VVKIVLYFFLRLAGRAIKNPHLSVKGKAGSVAG
jgi:hypothetical protein